MIINNKGFTFIELILYIAIVTIMLMAIVPFGWDAITSGAKSKVQQEVYSQGRFISERIKYEIRNATAINSPTSGTSASVLNLNSAPTTIIDLNSGKIRISQDGGSSYNNLNSNDTNITGLTFTSYTSSDNKTKNISFEFTITSTYSGPRQEYNESITMRGSAEVRSN